jgi:hypothetical protein
MSAVIIFASFAGGTSRFPQTPSPGPLTRTELPAREGEVAG